MREGGQRKASASTRRTPAEPPRLPSRSRIHPGEHQDQEERISCVPRMRKGLWQKAAWHASRMTVAVHEYTSTACLHGKCGSCRNTCKYCDSPCLCVHHLNLQSVPGVSRSWVDQARGIAAELLGAATAGQVPQELILRIYTDPDLFWLRGDVQSAGTWRES
jgi:hypothetical protein